MCQMWMGWIISLMISVSLILPLQAIIFCEGGQVGFFSGDILKLMDDIQTLRPTIFPAVPRLLNRIYDKVSLLHRPFSSCGQEYSLVLKWSGHLLICACEIMQNLTRYLKKNLKNIFKKKIYIWSNPTNILYFFVSCLQNNHIFQCWFL